MKKENLQWHPAFAAALRLTFQEETVCENKKIGYIFRGYNVIEYKSPEDNVQS